MILKTQKQKIFNVYNISWIVETKREANHYKKKSDRAGGMLL